MATVNPQLIFSVSHIPNHSLKKTHKIHSPKISKISAKEDAGLSLKELCRRGNLEEAVVSFGKSITKDSLSGKEADEAYSCLLELCASQEDLSLGQQIHAHLLKSKSVHDSVFLDTKLLFMYGKGGSIWDAEKVFERMPEKTIFSWNAFIGACINSRMPSEAIKLYKEMRLIGFPVDAHTFPCALKACGEIQDFDCGCEIHGLAIKTGLVSNTFIVNSLVNMYAKCGDIHAADSLFSRMSVREVVSWNSMISSYTVNGRNFEALKLFIEMLDVGVKPSAYTFVAVLDAMEELLFRNTGMAIHAICLKYLCHLDTYVTNALAVMYTRNGMMDEALRLFNDIKVKDKVAWNSMLSGYVQNGLYDEALNLFREINIWSWGPDEVAVICILAACGRSESLLHAREIHAFLLKKMMFRNLQVCNTLLDTYAKCGRIDYMVSVFGRMPWKDHVTWTIAISGYAQNECYTKALQLFQEMQMEKLNVDLLTMGSLLVACSGLKCTSLVKVFHGYILRRALDDTVIETNLVNAYGECGLMEYAFSVFKRNVENVVSFTSLLSSYVHNGMSKKALDLVSYMHGTNIELDSIGLLVILSAITDVSALRKGKEMHGFLLRKGFSIQGRIASSLLSMYASCGSLDCSIRIFNHIKNKDLVIWTSMIGAYGMHGLGREAIGLLKMMEGESCRPDHITFLSVMHACSHSALLDEGKQILNYMKDAYNLDPWPEHCTCVVDMLGRANYVEEALEFVEKMKVGQIPAVWSALLRACEIHSNEEIGKIAASKLLGLEPENAGNYVLASNTYASIDKWDYMEELRMKIKEKGLKKDPACSWIEVGDEVHAFTASDSSHLDSDTIYRNLGQITG